jgi:hypothetical protein
VIAMDEDHFERAGPELVSADATDANGAKADEGPPPWPDDYEVPGNGNGSPVANGSAPGEPYSTYKADERAKAATVQCLTADEFFCPESTASLVVRGLGICPGPPTGLVGQAYTGKTITALSFGLSVALGKPLWGLWPVQQGPWLHLDYEQGRRHTKARVRRLALGFGVADDELRGLIAAGTIRIAVFPALRLTTDKAADHYRRAFEGVRLVTCDSLRPMLGGIDENSSQVRAHVNVLTVASDASGTAVALILHGGKTPLDGSRPRKETARGSSGIIDELQSMFVMTKAKSEAVAQVTHEKDRELGEPVADFGLRIDDIPTDDGNLKGGLRVAHVDREQIKATASAPGLVKVMAAAHDCIRDNPGIAGAECVVALIGGTATTGRAAVKQLIADGKVVHRSSKRNGVRLYLSHMAPPEVT